MSANYMQWVQKSASVCLAISFTMLSLTISFSRYRIAPFILSCALLLFVTQTSLRGRLVKVYEAIESHYRCIILLIIGLGALERIFFWFIFTCGGQTSAFTTADYYILWSQSDSWASGSFVETKSWMTVGFYAIIRCLFGSSLGSAYVATFVIQLIVALIMADIVRKHLGKLPAIVAMTLVYLSPVFAAHLFNVATEHIYSLALILAISMLFGEMNCRKITLFSLAFVIAVWSRGEGILLLAVFAIVALWNIIISRFVVKSFVQAILIFVLMFLVSQSGARMFHEYQGTEKTVFCSNDNLWPRLFGANKETRGYYDSSDKRLIINQYLQHNSMPESWRNMSEYGIPEAFTAKCPKEVVPYVREEISRRWSLMSCPEKVKFSFLKIYLNISDPSPFPVVSSNRIVRFAAQVFAESVISLGAAMLFICSLGFWFKKGAIHTYPVLKVLPAALMICGQLCLLTVTEVSARYVWVLHLLLPMCVAPFCALQANKEVAA